MRVAFYAALARKEWIMTETAVIYANKRQRAKLALQGLTPHLHEQKAIEFIRDVLPDEDPYRLWALFDLVDASGRRYEIDALVLGRDALYLIEIKSHPGKVSGDVVDWRFTFPDGGVSIKENPLRLTSLKALCSQPELAVAFTAHLAQLAKAQMEGKHPGRRSTASERAKFALPVARALATLKRQLRTRGSNDDGTLRDQINALYSLQDEYKDIPFGTARLIDSMAALIVEKALRCALCPEEGPRWGYEAARDYCERYEPCYGTGLIPASAPMMEDVVDFWSRRCVGKPWTSLLEPKSKAKPRRAPKEVRAVPPSPEAMVSDRYPSIARWVQEGWVEIGRADWTGVMVRALDEGGMIWEGKISYPSLEAALDDLEAGIADWSKKNNDPLSYQTRR